MYIPNTNLFITIQESLITLSDLLQENPQIQTP